MKYILTTALLAAAYANSSVIEVTTKGNRVVTISSGKDQLPFDPCETCKNNAFTAKVIDSDSVPKGTIIRVKNDATFYDVSKEKSLYVLAGRATSLPVTFDSEGEITALGLPLSTDEYGNERPNVCEAGKFRNVETAEIVEIQTDCKVAASDKVTSSGLLEVTIAGNKIEFLVGRLSDGAIALNPFSSCVECKTSVVTAKVYTSNNPVYAKGAIIRVKSDGTFYDVSKEKSLYVLAGRAVSLPVTFDSQGKITALGFPLSLDEYGKERPIVCEAGKFRNIETAEIVEIQTNCKVAASDRVTIRPIAPATSSVLVTPSKTAVAPSPTSNPYDTGNVYSANGAMSFSLSGMMLAVVGIFSML